MKISGDFDFALRQLISTLQDSKSEPTIGSFASYLLYKWDQDRGNDWFISTRKAEQNEKD